MAALVESARRRVSQRGNAYAVLTLSDRSGQFQASCFEESTADLLSGLAESGECALLHVELDLPEGEEVPRIAVRSATPLARLSANTAMVLTIAVDDADALGGIARLIGARAAGGDSVVVRAFDRDTEQAMVLLGDVFRVDPDLVDLIGRIPGVVSAKLATRPAAGLA